MENKQRNKIEAEICSLLRKLIEERRTYFSKYEYLNSDGRRVFEKVAKLAIRYRIIRKEQLDKIREDPSLFRITRLVENYCAK